MEAEIYVIGIGYAPLGEKARGLIARAPVILASERLLAVFRRYPEYAEARQRVKVIDKVTETIAFLRARLEGGQGEPTVLLASGDPLFHGIGRQVLEEFGKDRLEIIPDLSSIQLAFARIKEPWDQALLISLHGGPAGQKKKKSTYRLDSLSSLIERHNLIAVLTDGDHNPAAIAAALPAEDDLTLYVCQRLGYPEETVIQGRPAEIAGQTFVEPNVVIIKRERPRPPGLRFGLTEGDFHHRRGMITKDEIRAVTIHKLKLPERGVLWDIGAGSGAVAIEAARVSPGLAVFAVEKEQEQVDCIKANRERFRVSNLEVVHGRAPTALVPLPDPDRVFVGGSGGDLKEILPQVAKRATPLVVINAATIETLKEAMDLLAENGYTVAVTEVAVARSRSVGKRRGLFPLNPVFIIAGEKQR